MPVPSGHGVCDVVDIDAGVLAEEGYHRNHGLAYHFQRLFENRVFGDCVLDSDSCCYYLIRCVDVALFAEGHHADPAACYEGAGTGAGDARRAVDTAWPGRGDEVLVLPESGGAIEDAGVAFWGEAVFVSVDGDGGNA